MVPNSCAALCLTQVPRIGPETEFRVRSEARGKLDTLNLSIPPMCHLSPSGVGELNSNHS
jgi:hypothetical protein